MENSKSSSLFKIFLSLLFLILPSVSKAEVAPEIATPVDFSSTDVNRIVCPVDVKDVIYSKEKGVKVVITGREVFVKFQVKQDGGKLIYTENPVELFIVCGDTTYNPVAFPKKIPSQTIYLSGDSQKVKHNLELFRGNTIETKILRIIKAAYNENYPSSFVIETFNSADELFYEGMNLRLSKTVRIQGEGLELKEYILTAQEDINLTEAAFLNLIKKPLAVSISDLSLTKGQATRLFILIRSDNE